MKTIEEIIIENKIATINEGAADLNKWFKEVSKTQQSLIKNNKPISLKINVKQIKGPNSTSKLKEIKSNDAEMEIINDKQVGFPIMSKLIAQKNLLMDADKNEYQPQVQRFFYVDGKSTYYIGLAAFDETIKKIEGYDNILNIEIIDNIANKPEVMKFIYNYIEEELKKKKVSGLMYEIKLPQVKGNLVGLGFKTSSENRNWVVKSF